MEIVNWLNANGGAIIGMAIIVLVGIAAYYAYLTRRLLRINNTPEIAISLRPHEAYLPCVMLHIENIGTGAARDIRFRTDLSFTPDGEKPLEELGFLKNGIDYLGPEQKIEHFLVSVADRFDELKKMPLEISVTYTDSVKLKRKHERSFSLDFSEDEGLARIGKPPLFEIAEATKQMQKDLHNFITGFHKPIVLTESLTRHRQGKRTNSLEIRIEQLPHEAQEEILSQIAVAVDKKEQEIRERGWQKQAATDTKKEEQ